MQPCSLLQVKYVMNCICSHLFWFLFFYAFALSISKSRFCEVTQQFIGNQWQHVWSRIVQKNLWRKIGSLILVLDLLSNNNRNISSVTDCTWKKTTKASDCLDIFSCRCIRWQRTHDTVVGHWLFQIVSLLLFYSCILDVFPCSPSWVPY